jgi:hypothetical protein
MLIISIDFIEYIVKLLRVETNKTMSAPQIISPAKPGWLQVVQDQVDALRFGVIQIVIHDSRVVQIERTQKVRLDRAAGLDGPRGAAFVGHGRVQSSH